LAYELLIYIITIFFKPFNLSTTDLYHNSAEGRIAVYKSDLSVTKATAGGRLSPFLPLGGGFNNSYQITFKDALWSMPIWASPEHQEGRHLKCKKGF
jgi:hypothetical protein